LAAVLAAIMTAVKKLPSIQRILLITPLKLTAAVNMFRTYKPMKTRMWANAQRDDRPAEHRWRLLFNAAKFGSRPLLDAVQ